jgi:general secretion pathway protein H
VDSLAETRAEWGPKRHLGSAAGFTLIEMLVVVLIMGLLIGLVSVVARPDARGLLRIEAERLAQLIDLAAAEASLTGRAIGWSAVDSTYRFWRSLDGAAWTEIRDNDLLRERTLPGGMTVSGLRVENMRREGALRLEFAPYVPPLFFTIELTLGTDHYIVRSAAGGSARALAGGSDSAPAL